MKLTVLIALLTALAAFEAGIAFDRWLHRPLALPPGVHFNTRQVSVTTLPASEPIPPCIADCEPGDDYGAGPEPFPDDSARAHFASFQHQALKDPPMHIVLVLLLATLPNGTPVDAEVIAAYGATVVDLPGCQAEAQKKVDESTAPTYHGEKVLLKAICVDSGAKVAAPKQGTEL